LSEESSSKLNGASVGRASKCIEASRFFRNEGAKRKSGGTTTVAVSVVNVLLRSIVKVDAVTKIGLGMRVGPLVKVTLIGRTETTRSLVNLLADTEMLLGLLEGEPVIMSLLEDRDELVAMLEDADELTDLLEDADELIDLLEETVTLVGLLNVSGGSSKNI
jgi:hypothetical protein